MSYRSGASIVLLLAVGGCGILDPVSGRRAELEQNRERWEATRPPAYTMVIERQCFCTVEARGPVRVTVQGTIPTQRVYPASGEAVSAELAPFFPTVDGLFGVLLDAYDRNAHEVRVTYDEDTGIPVDLWIDYEENTADEELGFSVTVPIDAHPGN